MRARRAAFTQLTPFALQHGNQLRDWSNPISRLWLEVGPSRMQDDTSYLSHVGRPIRLLDLDLTTLTPQCDDD